MSMPLVVFLAPTKVPSRKKHKGENVVFSKTYVLCKVTEDAQSKVIVVFNGSTLGARAGVVVKTDEEYAPGAGHSAKAMQITLENRPRR